MNATCNLILISALFLASGARSAERIEENHCVPDTHGAIERLAYSTLTDLSLWTNNKVSGRTYTQAPLNVFGIQNHFQGIARLRDSRFVVVSGANMITRTSQLYLIELGSQSQAGDLEENTLPFVSLPPFSDRMIGKISVADFIRWHVGGLTRIGDILVVPVENNLAMRSSRILFYDFSNPRRPKKLAYEIKRKHDAAAAVGIERLPDGRFVLIARDKTFNDIYYSRTTRIEDGFNDKFIRVDTGTEINGQGIQLFKQCDGRYFYANFTNDGKIPPILNGNDWIGFYEVSGITGRADDAVRIDNVARFQLECEGSCNFKAATGLEVSADQRLRVYGAPFYLNSSGTLLRLGQFAEPGSVFETATFTPHTPFQAP